jgi:hypothetical protein
VTFKKAVAIGLGAHSIFVEARSCSQWMSTKKKCQIKFGVGYGKSWKMTNEEKTTIRKCFDLPIVFLSGFVGNVVEKSLMCVMCPIAGYNLYTGNYTIAVNPYVEIIYAYPIRRSKAIEQ